MNHIIMYSNSIVATIKGPTLTPEEFEKDINNIRDVYFRAYHGEKSDYSLNTLHLHGRNILLIAFEKKNYTLAKHIIEKYPGTMKACGVDFLPFSKIIVLRDLKALDLLLQKDSPRDLFNVNFLGMTKKEESFRMMMRFNIALDKEPFITNYSNYKDEIKLNGCSYESPQLRSKIIKNIQSEYYKEYWLRREVLTPFLLKDIIHFINVINLRIEHSNAIK